MYIHIEPDSDIPIYSQVSTQIMEGIVRGELHHGDVLPSVRSLAADLGVNMHTINKSYHELERKGVITIVPKSGAVIRAEVDTVISEDGLNQVSRQLRPIIVEALVLGLKEDEITDLITSIISNVRETS